MNDLLKIPYVACIGGATLDLQGFSKEPLVFHDSNPGHVELSAGGVSRNIAENLARMGVPVKMISVTGDDFFGQMIRESSEAAGIDIREIEIIPGRRSCAYLSFTDTNGDMAVALSDMRLIKGMNEDFIRRHSPSLSAATLIVADPNLSLDALRCLCDTFAHIPIFIDTISTAYAKIVKPIMGRFHTIKVNQYEAEILSGVIVRSMSDARQAADIILNAGTKNVAITLGAQGAFYKSREDGEFIALPKKELQVVSATGAGDAFTAGLAYGWLHQLPKSETLQLATAAAAAALSHENTINPNIGDMLKPYLRGRA